MARRGDTRPDVGVPSSLFRLVDVPVRIDPYGPVAPYLQIAEDIRGQIRTGKLKANSRITESELVETYEVARSTARRTLAVLRDEGLIYTVPQRGSYVR